MTKTQLVENGLAGKEEMYAFMDPRKGMRSSEEDSKVPEGVYMMTTQKLLKKRKNIYPLCVMLLGGVLIVWLIGLTMVREFQLSSLRNDMKTLRTDVDNLKKTFDDSLMEEAKGFEDQINEEKEVQTPKPIFKIISDDDDIDDPSYDPSYEEDDFEDYSKSNYDYETPLSGSGSSGEEPIDKPDFLGDYMEATLLSKSQQSEGKHNFQKIMRIPKEDGLKADDEDVIERSKREIVGETPDGVPVVAEPYVVARARNFSGLPDTAAGPRLIRNWDQKQKHYKKYNDDLSTTAAPAPVYSRPSRVMKTDDDTSRPFRKVIQIQKPMTRSGLSADYDAAFLERRPDDIGLTRIRRRRKKVSRRLENLEDVGSSGDMSAGSAPAVVHGGPRRPLVAHFSGDTNEYAMETHEHYDGNGRLRHPADVPYTAWSPAPWLPALGMDSQFPLEDGAITIQHSGIYFVYVQIFYHDAHDTNSFKVFRNNGIHEDTILQCTTMTHSVSRIEKSNTCYTAGAFHLTKGDTLSVKNLGSMRYSIMQPGKSFFGLFKLR